jgi:hypothetical protein
MDDFLLDCCFNAIYEGLKFEKSTPRYATAQSRDSALCRIARSRDSALCGIARSFRKKFHRRLRAMQLNVKFNSKFSGRLRAMRHSAESGRLDW